MFAKTNIQLLLADLAEVGQMIQELHPDSITSQITLENRKAEIQRRIDELSESPSTAAIVQLLFTGAPVLDTRAIDASFAAKALRGYQDIVTKAKAAKKGKLGKRGVISNTATESTRFYITELVRGSFGFTLEENIDSGAPLFDSSLKDAVEDVSSVMDKFCDLNDDDYEVFIQDIDRRLFSSFKKFFTLLHESKAGVRIENNSHSHKFDIDKINTAFIRVEATEVKEEEKIITGMLLGLTPLSGAFDFLSNGQINYSGRISPSFIEEYRSQVEQGEFLLAGKQYEATMVKRTTRRNRDSPHTAYFLISLVDVSHKSI